MHVTMAERQCSERDTRGSAVPPAADRRKRPPTPRMVEVLRAIHDLSACGLPPSRREIMARLGFTSTNGASYYVDALESHGLLMRAAGLGRTTTLTQAGHDLLGSEANPSSAPEPGPAPAAGRYLPLQVCTLCSARYVAGGRCQCAARGAA